MDADLSKAAQSQQQYESNHCKIVDKGSKHLGFAHMFLGGKTNVYEEQIRSHDCSYTAQHTQMGRGMLVVKTDEWLEKAVCFLLGFFYFPK